MTSAPYAKATTDVSDMNRSFIHAFCDKCKICNPHRARAVAMMLFIYLFILVLFVTWKFIAMQKCFYVQ